MSYNQPPPAPGYGPPPIPPVPPARPGWTRKRIIIPASIGLFFVGIITGSAGSSSGSDNKTNATPAATVTVTAQPKNAAAKPAPTVTVTNTKTVTPKASKTKAAAADTSGKAVFKVWGSAPSGVDITYGSDGTNLQGSSLPMTKSVTVKDDAMYYQVTAQLQGGGTVHCSVTIDGKTKTGQASGGYNICSAQLNSNFSGGFS